MRYNSNDLDELRAFAKRLDPRDLAALLWVYSFTWTQETPATNHDAARELPFNSRGWAKARDSLIEQRLLLKVASGYSAAPWHGELVAHLQSKLEKARAKLGAATTATQRARAIKDVERLSGVPMLFSQQDGLFDDLGTKQEQNRAKTEPPVSGNQSEKDNDFNGRRSHTRARREGESESKGKSIPPVVPPSGDDDGEFAIPKTGRRKPQTSIPDGWSPPSLADLTEHVRARVEQWPEGELEREGHKFIADAYAQDRKHRDWNMAFGKWLLVHDGHLQERTRTRRMPHEKPSGWKIPSLGRA